MTVLWLAPGVYDGLEPVAGAGAPMESRGGEAFQAASRYVALQDASVGVAVMVAGRGVVYEANGDALFPLASIGKVPIMLAVLQQAIDQERDLEEEEYTLLEAMITFNDNDATTALWNVLGGGLAVEEYLDSHALAGFEIDPHGDWGETSASPLAVAHLLRKLATGELLNVAFRGHAIDLMGRVTTDQRWGVMAGMWDAVPPGTQVGVKDDWYPIETGWRVWSAGFLLPDDGSPASVIVILAQDQPTLEEGIAVVETSAPLLRAELWGPAFGELPRYQPRPDATDSDLSEGYASLFGNTDDRQELLWAGSSFRSFGAGCLADGEIGEHPGRCGVDRP